MRSRRIVSLSWVTDSLCLSNYKVTGLTLVVSKVGELIVLLIDFVQGGHLPIQIYDFQKLITCVEKGCLPFLKATYHEHQKE